MTTSASLRDCLAHPSFHQDSFETCGRGGNSSRAVRQRRDRELTSGSLRGEVAYWKEVSKYRKGQHNELKKVDRRSRAISVFTDATRRQQHAEAVNRWQAIQQQNDVTIGQLQEQTAQLMAFMNSSRMATVLNISEFIQLHAHSRIQESELRDKVQAEEARLAAQHQAIQAAQAHLMAKQAEQDKFTADMRAREALLVEREAAVEKHRAAVENEQATVSRLLQQARAESTRPCSAAATRPATHPTPVASPTRAILPHSGMAHVPRSNKAGSSTHMFLTAIPVSLIRHVAIKIF